MFEIDLGVQQVWADLLENCGCDRLASNLRQRGGMGQQIEPLGSLNSHHVENSYVEVIGGLAVSNLEGRGEEVVRREVDVAFIVEGVEIDPGERDVLAYLLNDGTIHLQLDEETT
jgi:hypothetical protein